MKRGLIDYRVFDFPSSYTFSESEPAEINRLDNLGALIYIYNLQNDSPFSFSFFIEECKYILKLNPKVTFHIFLHKIDI